MPIEIKQLRYAVATADAMSFSRAGAALNVKQSTLSRRVMALEQRLGVKLFERTTRGATPTETGKAFIEVARRIVTDVDNLRTTARAVNYGEAGRIAVGFSSSLSIGNLRLVIADYLQRFPDVQFDAVESGREQLSSGLVAKTIDIAILGADIVEAGLAKRALWIERIMVALPQSHALAAVEEIFWVDLRREVFVMPSQCGGRVMTDLLMMRFAAQGLKPNIILQDVSHHSVLNMVGFGQFVTIIGESAIGTTYPGIVFREVRDATGLAALDMTAYWREGNDNPALKRFFKLIDERYPVVGGS